MCDLDEELLAATADRYGIERRYTDYRRMVEEVAPDGVYAIGQPNIMFDIWIWCLRQGLNLYIEKPMGLTIATRRSSWRTWRRSEPGVITQVNGAHQRRSAPLLVRMRDECLRVRGPITHAVCEFYKCEPIKSRATTPATT